MSNIKNELLVAKKKESIQVSESDAASKNGITP